MLGPAGKGQLAIAVVVSLLMAQLVAGGLPVAVAQGVASTRAVARLWLRSQFAGWMLRSVAAGSIAASVAAGMLHQQESGWPLYLLIASTWLIATLSTAQMLTSAMLRGEGSIRRVNAVPLSALATYLALVACLFVFQRTSVVGVIALAHAPVKVWG